MKSVKDLYNAAYLLPQCSVKGKKCRLSFPVLLKSGNKNYCGFMVHFYDEPVPDGFVFSDMITEETKFYKNRQAAEELGVPIVNTLKEPDDQDDKTVSNDDVKLDDFDAAIFAGEIDKDLYNQYLMKVIDLVDPKERKFYRMFM